MTNLTPSPSEMQKLLELVERFYDKAAPGSWGSEGKHFLDEQEVVMLNARHKGGDTVLAYDHEVCEESRNTFRWIWFSHNNFPRLLSYIRTLEREHREMRGCMADLCQCDANPFSNRPCRVCRLLSSLTIK